MVKKYIYHLGEYSDILNIDILGGKGAKLSELSYLRYNVPDGFVLSTDAFRFFISQNSILLPHITKLRTIEIDNLSEIKAICHQIQLLFEECMMPSVLELKILEEFDKLGKLRVSVRSSNIFEDGIRNSFAGIFDTYLNITRNHLIEKIKDCWASIFTPHAIAYCKRFLSTIKDFDMAVIIQIMIDCDLAGVCFTEHPAITDSNDILLVEVVWGLGDAVVSGKINPEIYALDKKTRQVVSKVSSKQERMLCYDAESQYGIRWVDVPFSMQDRRKLSDEILKELSELCLDLEEMENFPCDIEFGIQNNEIFVLQCRPLTTIKKIDS